MLNRYDNDESYSIRHWTSEHITVLAVDRSTGLAQLFPAVIVTGVKDHFWIPAVDLGLLENLSIGTFFVPIILWAQK